jgi:hypothetical protein
MAKDGSRTDERAFDLVSWGITSFAMSPLARKRNLEAKASVSSPMPGRNGGKRGEVTSTSNCTDFGWSLNIKFKDEDRRK